MTFFVNFGHLLSEQAFADLDKLCHELDLRFVRVELNMDLPLHKQVADIVDSVKLTAEDWQTQEIVVALPGMSAIAGVLLAELHGRMGHFPSIVKFVKRGGVYMLDEFIDLDSVRAVARLKRQ